MSEYNRSELIRTYIRAGRSLRVAEEMADEILGDHKKMYTAKLKKSKKQKKQEKVEADA